MSKNSTKQSYLCLVDFLVARKKPKTYDNTRLRNDRTVKSQRY